MIENGHVSILISFDGYYKSIDDFYNVISDDCQLIDDGLIKLGKLTIVYDDFNKDTSKDILTIEDCQLEFVTNSDLGIIRKELKVLGCKITEEDKFCIMTIDPSGMKVKISQNNSTTLKERVRMLRIPYSGDIENIDRFYNALGVACRNGVFEILDVDLSFFSEKEGTQMITDGLDILFEKDCQYRKQIEDSLKVGGSLIDPDMDMNEMSYVKDPAGLRLALGYPDLCDDKALLFGTPLKETPKCDQSIFSKLLRSLGLHPFENFQNKK